MTQLLHTQGNGPVRHLARVSDLDPGALADEAMARAERTLPWFGEIPDRRREHLHLVTKAGFVSFFAHLRAPGTADPMDMFAVAPRELVRSVTLQQTLQLMRVTSSLVEENIETPQDLEASVVFSRQLAFAAAELYAQVGDGTGLWEHRLEQFVIDASHKGALTDSLIARIRSVGWRGDGAAVAACGEMPESGDTDIVRRRAWNAGADVLVGTSSGRLIVIAALVEGHEADELQAVIAALADGFGAGPVVVGPVVDTISSAWQSLVAANAGADVVGASDQDARVVYAADLLPERVLAGDPLARRDLINRAYRPLRDSRQPLLQTVRRFVEAGGAVETAARKLDVHPNTVRYRLKRAAEVTGFDPTAARDAFVLQCALRLGLMEDAAAVTPRQQAAR
ncbi:PucR family transcriptional regulator [Salinibacterium hongtaonis]|uniref:PucR family transcriptional regulator n=1 Tax=Homoserinimonas hongtaonis TaxID=2079791 RepID=A0A2U1T2N3_9MICO|nr:helix-turn-helix domain-containing protein [Salinibacterium hongtaonis]PWB98126.1 PucR family transcriptional regulator [Salinibacterium hongtaonis]